jgi:hypothetical protein
MKIVKDFPPNFADIEKTFDLEGLQPVFAYGDTLYNPGGFDIPDDLMAHEETHERQQKELGPQAWWDRYLGDREFRLMQEAEAYRNQYLFVKGKYSRQVRRKLLQDMAKNLSSKLYGNIISKKEAEYLISNDQ